MQLAAGGIYVVPASAGAAQLAAGEAWDWATLKQGARRLRRGQRAEVAAGAVVALLPDGSVSFAVAQGEAGMAVHAPALEVEGAEENSQHGQHSSEGRTELKRARHDSRVGADGAAGGGGKRARV